LNASDVARARVEATYIAFNAPRVSGIAGAQVQRQRHHEQSKRAASRHDLKPAHEAAVHKMVHGTALAVNENFEFSADQISCVTELQAEMNKTVHRCVFENLGDQAQLHALGVHIKGDGHQLMVELNSLYRGFPTKYAVDLTKQITDFPVWFERTKSLTDYFVTYQPSVEQLRRIYSNQFIQRSFVLTPRHKSSNYCESIIQFDTTDAGTIKLKDLYMW
jgi:hypothetical protein